MMFMALRINLDSPNQKVSRSHSVRLHLERPLGIGDERSRILLWSSCRSGFSLATGDRLQCESWSLLCVSRELRTATETTLKEGRWLCSKKLSWP